ncbi:MAG: glycosyltransferase [Kiritimatiellae bacterium]|nr:glycosyltransferase [Kiritimatiellia bacterium]
MSEAPAPAISIVIPFRNEATTLPLALDSLARQQFDRPFEVIFVDGHSTDPSVEVIRSHPLGRRAEVRILSSPAGRTGMNHARNDGARAARAPILLFMQADVRIRDPQALLKVLRAFDDPTVVATTFTGLGAGEDFYRYDFWGQVFLARYQRLRCEHDLDTKFNGVRREIFEKIGGFDEARFPFGGEDFDFRVRLLREGRLADTGVEVEHLHGYGRRHTPLGLLRKYARNAECMGATVPVYLRHLEHEPGYLRHLVARTMLCVACLATLVPPAWPWAPLVVLAFASLWSAPVWREVRGWRLIAVPPFAIAAMYVFTVYYLRALIAGRTAVRLTTTTG